MNINLNISFLIAFLLPGFICGYALIYVSDFYQITINNILLHKENYLIDIGFIAISSIIIGLILSAARRIILDNIHYSTGVVKRTENYSNLVKEKLELFNGFIDNKYRYAQFYGNIFISILIFFVFRYFVGNHSVRHEKLLSISILIVLIILFFESRLCLIETNKAYNKILEK